MDIRTMKGVILISKEKITKGYYDKSLKNIV